MVTVKLLNGIEKQTPKVLHVFILKKILFSTKQFDKVVGEMHIKQRQYTLINKSRDIIAKCKLDVNLYEFGETIKNESKFIATPTTIQINMANLWHLRFGHINNNIFKNIQTLAKGVDSFNEKDITFCTPCIERKQHRIKFPKEGFTKSTQILGLIHYDIYGPLQTYTYGGCKYFITFIDDKSRYCFVYLMKNKYEAFDELLIYKAFIEKQTSHNIYI